MNVAQKIKTPLYDRDFVLWTEEQAKLLRARRFHDIDLANLIEEVVSLGRSDKRSTDSQLVRLQAHLLKWHYQAGKRSSSWRSSIANARVEISLLFEQSPSLRRHSRGSWVSGYGRARRLAAVQTRLPLGTFPEEPPFTLDQVLDDDFWPD
jgi:hypothetical protein